jgi:LysR family transcriptional regulator (chromosome initiation inhibitor)
VQFDHAQLEALAAAVDQGTLDAAARALHVTPYAVSQRLSALEAACGRVLLERTRPVRVTASGAVVLRLARQIGQLADDVTAELGFGAAASTTATVSLAVNSDSLATWVLPALAPLARGDENSPPICLDLHREDEQRTVELLRAGTVMAAVTARAEPVAGCTSTPLGVLRYRPTAAPDFIRRWFPSGPTPAALTAAPVVTFDDDLQHEYLRRRLPDGPMPPAHVVPASAEFSTAVLMGFGWGMLPDLQSESLRRTGELVVIDDEGGIDVELHWQQWKRAPAALHRVTTAMLATAGRVLRPPVSGPGRPPRRPG